MKKIIQNIKLAGLIAQKLSGRISKEENERLESWKKETDKNSTLYKKIVNWENFQNRNKNLEHFDATKAWEEVSYTIEGRQSQFSIGYVLRVAAAIILPLILGGVLFYYFSGETGTVPQQTASISPGTQNAMVILDDGRVVNLEDQKMEKLRAGDGLIILNKKGELNYLDAGKQKPVKPLKNTLLVPRGGEYNLVLSDGTKVYLNSVSKLTYPVTFSGDKREVTLEGEAYFEVTHNEMQPFIVNVNGMKVEVLGTTFNINAYQAEDEVYTTLVSGKVKVNTDNSPGEWVLAPDQQAVLSRQKNSVEVRNVDAQMFIGWKEGVYTFSNQSLGEIMKTLSRWYDFDYEFANDEVRDITFEGGLNKYEEIYPILEIIESTGKAKITINGTKIIFS